ALADLHNKLEVVLEQDRFLRSKGFLSADFHTQEKIDLLAFVISREKLGLLRFFTHTEKSPENGLGGEARGGREHAQS
ncbi:MAG: hypothetical protein JXR37_03915, partial [Kiritimatiellae bacterium]|nr:hypothetical protein [Kiritimatiellia bacterium]